MKIEKNCLPIFEKVKDGDFICIYAEQDKDNSPMLSVNYERRIVYVVSKERLEFLKFPFTIISDWFNDDENLLREVMKILAYYDDHFDYTRVLTTMSQNYTHQTNKKRNYQTSP